MKRAAFFCLLAFAASASASVVYSGPRNIPIPIDLADVYLDVQTGTTGTGEFTGWDINVFFGGLAIGGNITFQPARTGPLVDDPVRRFDINELIVSTLPYGTGYTGSAEHLGQSGNFQAGETGYLGFRFTLDNLGNGTPLYGWMRLTLMANTPGGTIHDWAWESNGSGITTGSVPEPEGIPLAFATVGLLCLRRSRQGTAV